MTAIIEFVIWIKALITKALEWFLEVPSKLVLFITTFASVITASVTYIANHTEDVIRLFDSASQKVDVLGNSLSQHQVGSMFAYVTSLDVAAEYTISVVGIFCGIVGVLVVTLFSYVVTQWILPMVLMLIQKIISLTTAGFVKT